MAKAQASTGVSAQPEGDRWPLLTEARVEVCAWLCIGSCGRWCTAQWRLMCRGAVSSHKSSWQQRSWISAASTTASTCSRSPCIALAACWTPGASWMSCSRCAGREYMLNYVLQDCVLSARFCRASRTCFIMPVRFCILPARRCAGRSWSCCWRSAVCFCTACKTCNLFPMAYSFLLLTYHCRKIISCRFCSCWL